jgi:hypothetical protein
MKLEEARKLRYWQSVLTDTNEILTVKQDEELTQLCPAYKDLAGNEFIYVHTERGVWPSNRLSLRNV